jgi:hypothetical protein
MSTTVESREIQKYKQEIPRNSMNLPFQLAEFDADSDGNSEMRS